MATQVVVRGAVTPDGKLELVEPVGLPPGPVEVTVTATEPATGEDLMALLARIRAGQEARGHVPRSAEEIGEDIRRIRDEAEEEMQMIEKLHTECRQQRDANAERGHLP